MVKVIDYGETLKRTPTYYKCKCNHCGAELVFEYSDIWFDQPMESIGRVECPVCRTKVFMDFGMLDIPITCHPKYSTKDEYDHAYRDTSKRGIQQLMEEKKKEGTIFTTVQEITNESLKKTLIHDMTKLKEEQE